MRLLVAETASSVWSYHLRDVPVGQEKYGGAAGPALCGTPLGWDTHIPVNAWGQHSHIPERWCSKCTQIAKKAGQKLGEGIK